MGFKSFIKGVGSSIKSGAKGLASDIKSGAKGLASDIKSGAKGLASDIKSGAQGFKRDIVDSGLLATGIELAAGFLPGGSLVSGALGVASSILGGMGNSGAEAATYEPDLEQIIGYPYPTPETQVAAPSVRDAKSIIVLGSGSVSSASGSGASGSSGSGASAASFAPLLLGAGALYLLSKKSSGV